MDWTQFKNPKTTQRGANRRILIVAGMFVCGFVGVSAKLWWVQRIEGAALAQTAAELRRVEEPIPSLRGSVYDRDGELLAQSRTLHEVYADKYHLQDPKVIAEPLAIHLGLKKSQMVRDMPGPEMKERYLRFLAETLSPVAGISQQEIYNLLSPGGKTAPLLAKELEKEVARVWQELIEKHSIKGVKMRSYTKRFFPANERALNVLGLVNAEGKGIEGVEELMNDTLVGKDGVEITEKDVLREDILPGGVNIRQEPQHGSHAVLTLDMDTQQFTDDVMLEAKAKYNATKAIALIIEPNTGSLIAMTGVPKRQPHAVVPGAFESRNMAVTDIYEPGSTMKIMTVAAALEAGAITSKSTLFLNSGSYYDKEHKFQLTDHHPMEWASIADIMKHSSNIGAFKIAQKLGKDRFYTALHQFGLGQQTELHLPREAKGLLKPGDTWKGPTLSRIAMGYQVSVTPLQLIMAVGAIANQGKLMKPRLIDRTISADGLAETITPVSKVRDVCSPRVANIVTEMLEAVVNDGTGDQAAIPGVRVAGKTGTAKLYDPTAPGQLKYRDGHYIVSFVGFAPVENPQLACLIILEDPKVNDQSLLYGGKLAAPIFSKVMTTALKYHQAASTRRPRITVVQEGGAP